MEQTQSVVVCDLDGTLCDVRGIRHLVEPVGARKRRDFKAFHDRSIECPRNESVVQVLDEARAQGHAIVIVTARQSRWGFMSALWLSEMGIAYDVLRMRDNRDPRPDAEVKEDILSSLASRHRVVLAIDDNPQTIDVWTRASIPTLQVDRDARLARLLVDEAHSSSPTALETFVRRLTVE